MRRGQSPAGDKGQASQPPGIPQMALTDTGLTWPPTDTGLQRERSSLGRPFYERRCQRSNLPSRRTPSEVSPSPATAEPAPHAWGFGPLPGAGSRTAAGRQERGAGDAGATPTHVRPHEPCHRAARGHVGAGPPSLSHAVPAAPDTRPRSRTRPVPGSQPSAPAKESPGQALLRQRLCPPHRHKARQHAGAPLGRADGTSVRNVGRDH